MPEDKVVEKVRGRFLGKGRHGTPPTLLGHRDSGPLRRRLRLGTTRSRSIGVDPPEPFPIGISELLSKVELLPAPVGN